MFIEEQEIKYIPVKKLVLWSENPRDTISSDSSNEDIILQALIDKTASWNLKQLASAMGDYFDYSEIPTVVYKNDIPVVYDGNCRVILAMLKLGLYKKFSVNFKLPEVSEKLPCNVCSEQVALKNIFRKHAQNGSWKELERDIFMHKYMQKNKSDFLILDESTNLISSNPELNKNFVKNEVFSPNNLNNLGFSISYGQFKSKHSMEDTKKILTEVADAVISKKITTRKNRFNIIGVLPNTIKNIISLDEANTYSPINGMLFEHSTQFTSPRLRKRTKNSAILFFGRKIILRQGLVNNLYRDILSLYDFYCEKSARGELSTNFIGLIRMALRLIVEAAAKDSDPSNKIDKYVETYFEDAKRKLSQDMKTYLHENNVTEKTLTGLLNIGAHNYEAALSVDKAISMSVIIGEMLDLSHGVDR